MPITLASGITATGVDSAAVTGALGYTPVNKAGDTMSGQLLQASGTAALPSYSMSGEPNTGFYRSQAAVFDLSMQGVQSFRWGSTGFYLPVSTAFLGLSSGGALTWSSNVAGTDANDLFIYRAAPNISIQRNGINAQFSRLSNTYTDASNGEWLEIGWNANVASILPKANGTGVVRALVLVNGPVTNVGTTYTVLASDTYLIANAAATQTLTLGTATAGRVLRIKTTAAFTVVSASSNVVPLAGGAASTAILAATAGKYAELVGDGTNWIIMSGN